MRRDRAAYADALATVEQFIGRLAAKKPAWFWPTIAAALTSKHHWLVIACDSCDTVIDLDLTVKRRDPNAPVRIALDGSLSALQWSRAHPHRGIVALSVDLRWVHLLSPNQFVLLVAGIC